ncbi:hypothetical protein TNCV_3896641 [Trichonephila clavipes]|nr:hypothetical protein TNCV_3896641 [Trichonephila clavipes]
MSHEHISWHYPLGHVDLASRILVTVISCFVTCLVTRNVATAVSMIRGPTCCPLRTSYAIAGYIDYSTQMSLLFNHLVVRSATAVTHNFGEKMPAEVSSSSLDRGSKLRGPLPIGLGLLFRCLQFLPTPS